jgi:acyl-homoserine-lactone acylase
VTVTGLSSLPLFVVLGVFTLGAHPASGSAQAPGLTDLARQVEVRRTTYGVPHIRAQNLVAANYALAYVQLEDYGARVAMGLLRARGEMGLWFGRDSMESDFGAQREYALAVQNYPRLEQATRDVYEGFAAGVNRYIELHPNEFPAGFKPNFTGYDVAARDVTSASLATARRFMASVERGD